MRLLQITILNQKTLIIIDWLKMDLVYDFHKNFTRVYGQFIDIRLVGKFIANNLVELDSVANTVSHLLIYEDAIKNIKAQNIIICDHMSVDEIKPRYIYIDQKTQNHLSYMIDTSLVQQILNMKPLTNYIHSILIDKFGYIPYYINKNVTHTDIWYQLFDK